MYVLSHTCMYILRHPAAVLLLLPVSIIMTYFVIVLVLAVILDSYTEYAEEAKAQEEAKKSAKPINQADKDKPKAGQKDECEGEAREKVTLITLFYYLMSCMLLLVPR